MNHFDDQQLDDFATSFYQYGPTTAPYVLIGMEEGGGNDFNNVQRRLDAWERRGRRGVDDIKEFHEEFGEGQFFDPIQPARQQTWSTLSALMCAINGQQPHSDAVREFRLNKLGRSNGQTWLTELLPLPSPSKDHFYYHGWSSLPWLQDREHYVAHYAPLRAVYLRKKIEASCPQAVIFYSKDQMFQPWWRMIAGTTFERVSASGIELAREGRTLYAVIEHPRSFGGYDYFVEAGRIIATALQSYQLPRSTSLRANGPKGRSIQRNFWHGSDTC